MNRLFAAALILALSAAASADVVTERWGSIRLCQHKDKAEYVVADGGRTVVKFDLSALPKRAKIIRARFCPYVKTDGFPRPQPIVVQVLTQAHQAGGAPAVQKTPLALLAPRFVSFDATDVVARWASGKLANHGLCVAGATPVRSRTFLEITYEGKLADPPPPVGGLKAFHRAGQVFLTWQEINSVFAGKDEAYWDDFKKEADRIASGRGKVTTYRIYRHSRPITRKTIGQAELLDEVPQYSCFDPKMVKTKWMGEQIKNVKVGSARVPRTAVEPNSELKPGTGVYVRTSDKAGRFHYAVIATVNGMENTTALDAGCTTAKPLVEKIAPPKPILFRTTQLQYQRERTLYCYVWWVDPPLTHRSGFVHVGVTAGPKMGNPPADPKPSADQAKRIEALIGQLAGADARAAQAEAELVKIGPAAVTALVQSQRKSPKAWPVVPRLAKDADDAAKARAAAARAQVDAARRLVARTMVKIRVANRDKATAAPLLVHGYWWSGGWNTVHPCPQPDGVTLAINDHPWQVRGIHEANGTYKAWSQGKIKNFYIRRIKALLPWVKAHYNADLERVYAFSGGWAWHYPEIFAATFEVLSMNPKRSPAMPEVRRYWNDPKKAPDSEWGMSPYEYWNAGEWIKNHPKVELAYMSYTPYQHLGDFGRIDKPAYFAAMRDTKHAFACTFDESRGWYGMANAGWVLELRRTDSIPAFTNGSLDDNPGIGAGWDPGGKINYYLCAEPRTQVDSAGRWEMTVYLYAGDRRGRGAAPLDTCTADVTPRRCRLFKAKPGAKFTWTNTSIKDKKVVQTGQAVADKHGLVTAQDVIITKGKNRLVIVKAK